MYLHAIAEEAELWSSLAINTAVIFGAVPTAIALMRKVPSRTVTKVALGSALLGFVAVFAMFLTWTVSEQEMNNARECALLREQLAHGETTTVGGALLLADDLKSCDLSGVRPK